MSNRTAFLDMIAGSEIGAALLKVSDNGYNVLVGSTAGRPLLFESYAKHPCVLHTLANGLRSTAAGRYQLLARYFEPYRATLGLVDFSPKSQDAIALQQIRECHALDDIDAGRFSGAVAKVSHLWASLPGAGYGQHENAMAGILASYVQAGGVLAC